MIELERHIEILLLENDCVIVPDLGGFMAHHCEARYDAEDHLFLPPQRTLGFNPQLKLNDSLLAQSYVEAYDISYPEAIRRIEAEVTELWQHLRAEGFYDLNDIGRLTFNDEGRLAFEPCEAGILTPELYGLSTLEFKYLPAFVPATKDDSEKSHADNSLSADEAESKEALTIPMSWVRNTIAIAAAILAFFIFTTPVSNDNLSGMSMSQVNLPLMIKDTNIKATPAQFNRQAIRKTIQKKDMVAVDTVAATTAKKVVPAAVPAPAPYCIVLASQVTERNANEFISKLRDKGIEARIYMHKNVRRVVCGYYSTEAEAYQAMHDIHRQDGLSEAWVYKLRN